MVFNVKYPIRVLSVLRRFREIPTNTNDSQGLVVEGGLDFL